jgi:hypothetical protein
MVSTHVWILVKVSLLVAGVSVIGARAGQNGPESFASIISHGAICDGNGANAEADTAAAEAIAAAGQDIYLPSNNYCIFKRPIALHRPGQRIFGDGPAASKILVYDVFGANGRNGFDEGVLNLEAPGQEVRGISMSFRQPAEPKRRSDLVTYQPAIRARQPATDLADLLIAGATTCIDMGGNSNAGNSHLTKIDTGCFDYGIRLDGSLDTVSIQDHHSYPFQMTGAQAAVFGRAQNIAIDLGRVDDYAIQGGLCLGQTCLNLFNGAQGGAFGTVTGYDFDGAAIGINMTTPNASLVGAALTFSSGSDSQHAIIQSAGRLVISGSSFFAIATTALDTFTGGLQSITGSEWNVGRYDAAVIIANCLGESNAPAVNGLSATSCRITLSGNTVERDPSIRFQHPWLDSLNAEVVIATGNSVTATSQGGPFIKIANDTPGNRVIGNSSPGWTNYVANIAMPNQLTPLPVGGIGGIYNSN